MHYKPTLTDPNREIQTHVHRKMRKMYKHFNCQLLMNKYLGTKKHYNSSKQIE